MGDLVSDLAAPSEELIETHISWVFLHPGEVFKVKKPVDFGFLDFSDRARRERACHAEVELNSRLAPGVYRGVVPITRDAGGHHAIMGDGAVVDYAVHMSRLPRDARADLRLRRGELSLADVDRLARALARFHARADRSERISRFGRVEVIRGNIEENFAQARAALRKLAGEAAEREVEERQLAFLETHRELLARRVEGGYIRDGHGDLRLEHVYLVGSGDPIIIDCIEFNERFRYADVCADLAFLSMDLGWHGRHEDKERLLARYVRESWDHDLYALVDFYESYRAYVRAKVTAFSLDGRDLSFAARATLEQEARRYLLLAQASERPGLARPRLWAVGGLIASGKSTLAEALAVRIAAIAIGSDETRKRLRGVAPTAPLQEGAWQDAYGPEVTERVYAELFERARVVLDSGRSVVLDASFRSREQRAAARRLASASSADFTFVECRVPDAVARARLGERARAPSVSDGRLEIYDAFRERFEPVTELGASECVVVDTRGSTEESLAQLSEIAAAAR